MLVILPWKKTIICLRLSLVLTSSVPWLIIGRATGIITLSNSISLSLSHVLCSQHTSLCSRHCLGCKLDALMSVGLHKISSKIRLVMRKYSDLVEALNGSTWHLHPAASSNNLGLIKNYTNSKKTLFMVIQKI